MNTNILYTHTFYVCKFCSMFYVYFTTKSMNAHYSELYWYCAGVFLYNLALV